MISVWQSVQGDYRPSDIFEQSGIMVIARNIKLVEDTIWQWEECRMNKSDFIAILAAIDNQTSDGMFDIASLADENGEAINELAEILDDIDSRVTALEEKE